MAYIQKDGLCFTTAKGNVYKKVHSMHELEYLIHQINDYFETFFRNTKSYLIPVHSAEIDTKRSNRSTNRWRDGNSLVSRRPILDQ
jgi:hypothetical protein